MPEELRHPTKEEGATLQAARSAFIYPTAGNLLVVMGLYAVVNRCQWFPVTVDFPQLELPSVEALQQKAVDLGRCSSLWMGIYDFNDLETGLVIDPMTEDIWEFGDNRLGQSNTGLNGNDVKIVCHRAKDGPEDGRRFSLYANTGSSEGDHDASIKLELRFAEGFAHLARLLPDHGDDKSEAWDLLLRNCEGGARLAGTPTMLEEGWIL